MLEVWRQMAVRTPSAAAVLVSTESVWAGRPFFIRIGVSQASLAPASSSAAMTDGQTRGSRSSTLDSMSSGRSSGPGFEADEQPQHVGMRVGVAPTRADADRVDGHGRLRSPRVREGGEQGGTGGSAGLGAAGTGEGGVAAEQLRHGGRGHRHLAVRALHRARADRDGGDGDAEVGG